MKKVLFLCIIMMALASVAFISCGSEETVGDTQDNEGVNNDGTVADKDGTTTADNTTTEGTATDNGGNVTCGNGKIESPEVCDGGAKDCTELNATKYEGGVAACASDCKSYDVANCVEKAGGDNATTDSTNTGAYGTLAGSGNFGFIFDGAKLNDSAYQQANQQKGFQMSAAFAGNYGTGKTIPPTPAPQYVFSLAVHEIASGSNPAAILVMQQCQTGQNVVNPIVQAIFPSDNITPGQVTVGLTQGNAQLYVLNSTGSSSSCMLAIAFEGTINVTAATNTTALDGGTLAMTSSGIKIYYPKETPEGDISGQLGSTTVCPKE